MTLDEAIKREGLAAKEQDKLRKRYDDASGYTRSHNEDIRTNDARRCERCAEEHRQLAEWLKELKQLSEAYEKLKVGHEVLEMEYEVALNEIQRLRDAAKDAKNEINNTVKVREGCALGNGISVGLKMAAGIIDKYMKGE